MSGYVLHTAVVPVNWQPVVHFRSVSKSLCIVRIYIADEIPGRAGPLWHGIGLSLCIAAAFRAFAVYEGFNLGKWGLSVLTWLEVFDLRQTKRKLLIRNCYVTALRTMNDRNRLAPISLAVKCPVLHLVLNTSFPNALLLQLFQHTMDGVLLIRIAIEEIRVDHFAVACIGFFLDVTALDYLNDINAKFLRKVIVSLVVCRYRHDGTGTISHHYIVCNIDRDLLAIYRIHTLKALNAYTGFLFYKLGSLKLCFLRTLFTVCLDGIHVGNAVCIFVDQRMLWCDNHKGYTEQGIWSGGIDLQCLINSVNCKVHECTCRFPDPVYLLLLDVSRIVNVLQSLKKLVRILGDSQIPDILGLLDNVAVADVTFSTLAVLIGKNNFAGWTVVYQCLITEYQSVLKHFQENPLCPFVEILLCSVDHTAPVKGESNALQLVGEFRNVLVCDLTGMCVRLDRIVLSRKSESIESDRKQYVITLHSSLSGKYLDTGVCFDMAYVHSGSTWVRELYKAVEFRFITSVNSFESLLFFPFFLPFRLDFLKIVFHYGSSI